MKSNRPNPSAMPSPTFTYATACTVPRSSPLLSSSFTPFYPRSQQQLYNSQLGPPGNHDGGFNASPQKSHDNNIDKGHPYAWSCARGPEFYDQQYYARSGSEPYEEVSWIANNGNMWGGGAWQWGDPAPVEYAYGDADDDAEDSAYLLSDSLSYYAESPALEHEFYACSTSNIESVPAPFPDKGAATSFSVFHSSVVPEQASFLSKSNESSMPSFRKLSTKEQAVSVCSSEKQGTANGIQDDVATASASSKLDTRPFSSRVSSQMGSSVGSSTGTGSQAIEPRLKQVTTDMADNKRAPTESSKLLKNSCKLSIEQGSVDSIESKHSIDATSNPSNTLELFEGTNLDSSTISLPTKVIQKEVGKDSSCFQSGHIHLQSASDHYPVMNNTQAWCSPLVKTAPREQITKGSCLNKPSLVMEMEGKKCVEAMDLEAMHQDKTSSSYSLPGDAGLCSNGPQLLVKSIHNLSKVLLCSQSGTSFSILDPTDCLAIENTICMLSHRLSQLSVNESNFCQDQDCSQLQVAEHELKSYDESTKSCKEEVSEVYLQKCSGMKHNFEMVSPKRALENEAWENSSKVTARSWVGGVEKSGHSTSVKKNLEWPWEELLMLRGQVRKVQEEVAYERAESNATVSIYKKLWSEAQEALKVSRSEIGKMRAELAGFYREFGNVKHLEGSGGLMSTPVSLQPTKYGMSNCVSGGGVYDENLSGIAINSSTAPDLCRAPNGDENVVFCGSSKEHLPESSEVLNGYFDPGEMSYCRDNWTPFSNGEKAILRLNNQVASSNQSSNKFGTPANEKHTFGPPTNLEDEVTWRLSLLLARQGLDLNKACTDRNVESPSNLSTLLDPSSDLLREGEAMPPDKNFLIWSETSHLVNSNKAVGCAKADLNCQKKSDFEVKNSHHGLVGREPTGRAMNAAEEKISTYQEDEIEIICFKPGVADSNFMCMKGEPEWEHVVVNALDDSIRSQKVQ